MSNLVKLDFKQLGARRSKGGSGVLSLVLDGGRLEGLLLRRTNGSVEIQQSISVALSLDPLTAAPELVGREIRNHLDAAGLRERRCVVGLPLKWALTVQVKLPDLPEADVESFLQIEAERGFPCDVATLMLATSRYSSPTGEKFATLAGVPRNYVTVLDQVLRAAQLRPESFTLGIAALQPSASEHSNGVLALSVGESHVGLQVTCGGGVAALRALEGALETRGGQKVLHADLVFREARITLGQMPAEIRGALKMVRVFGPRDLAQQLADEIELRLESMDLRVESATAYHPGELPLQVPREAVISPALSLGVRHLAGGGATFEFLPPRVSPYQQFMAKYSSGAMQRAGAAAAVLALLVGGAFLAQQIQIWRLKSQGAGVQRTARELQETQARIRKFRAWYDESLRNLTILKCLTEAFPEDGSVTAKTLEIRDLNTVTCNGTARDYQSLLRTVERLRGVPQIPDVSLGQTRGQSPNLQFQFSFVWSEGGNRAN
jgi:hypothetical protein